MLSGEDVHADQRLCSTGSWRECGAASAPPSLLSPDGAAELGDAMWPASREAPPQEETLGESRGSYFDELSSVVFDSSATGLNAAAPLALGSAPLEPMTREQADVYDLSTSIFEATTFSDNFSNASSQNFDRAPSHEAGSECLERFMAGTFMAGQIGPTARAAVARGPCIPGPGDRGREAPAPPHCEAGLGSKQELTPMLSESNLQLKMGLGVGAALNLTAWQYGEAVPANCPLTKGQSNSLPAGFALCRPPPPGVAAACLSGVPMERQCWRAMGAVPGVGLDCVGQVPQADPLQDSIAADCKPAAQPIKMEGGGGEAIGHKPCSPVAPLSPSSKRLVESASNRHESLERYREKKRHRLNAPTIRYHRRKVQADLRPRMKGRFVKAGDCDTVPDIAPEASV